MTVVKINTIGTGVTNDYQTIGHWWESVKTATSSNLVSDDRILIGRLSEGNHALPSSLIMYSGHVTTDASRYVILDVQDNRGFSGILPLVTTTQVSHAFVTGNNAQWINCTVPYTQFRNFIIQPNDNVSAPTSVNNYFLNVQNTGLIDSVGLHHVGNLINSHRTGIKFDIDIVKLSQGSQIRNSVILSPNMTISGNFISSNFRVSAITYRDNCSVYNNTILGITGAVHVDSTSQDTCRLELYGIREDFSPTDISGCRLWCDFDDVTTMWTNYFTQTPLLASGNGIARVGNKSIPTLYDPFQLTTIRQPVYVPNFLNNRGCAYAKRGSTVSATTNGSGFLVSSMFAAKEFDRGYSIFVCAQIHSGIQNSHVLLGTRNLQQSLYFSSNTLILRNELTATDIDDANPFDTTSNITNIARLLQGSNPLHVYTSVVDVSGIYAPSGISNGYFDLDASGIWTTTAFTGNWNNQNFQLGRDVDIWYINGRAVPGGSFTNVPEVSWGELILYTRPLSSGEVYQVHRYLINKWNINDYNRTPDDFSNNFSVTTGNVYNNFVEIQPYLYNTKSYLTKSYSIPHDSYSNNASSDNYASGLFPNNINYTGLITSNNFVNVANSSSIDAHILQAAPLRGSGQNLSSIFNYDVDELPRSNNGWDVGADEWLFSTTGNTTLYIQGYSNNTGIIDFFIQGYSVNTGILDLFIQGYLQSSSNIDFTINGFLNQTGNIDLSIQGYLPQTGLLDLYIQGYLPKTGILDLSIVGYSTDNNNCPLHIYGYSPQNNSLDLSLVGYLQNSGNIPLTIQGYLPQTGNIDLSINGYLPKTGILDLTIQGYLPQTGNLDLFIRGNIADNYATTLCIIGQEVSNTGLPLWLVSHNTGNQGLDLSLVGFLNQTGTMDLSINGYLANNNSCNMTIVGSRTENSGLDLYIKGHQVSTGYCDLSIYGYDNKTGTLDLTINGNIVSDTFNTLPLTVIAYDVTNNYAPLTIVGNLQNNNNLNLNINGYDIQNNNIPLTIVGNLASDLSNNLNLILNGYLPKTGNLDMSLLGMLNSTNACPISIYGYDANNNNISMVVNGSQSTNNNIGFSISGVAGTNHNLNLFISGPVSTTGRSEDATLFIVGYDSQINNVPMFLFGPSYIVEGENVRDCMCDFEIPAELIDLHESGVGSLITNLGVPCTLYYPPKKTQCPNCEFDARTKKSANIYRAGGPISFTAGACPYCNGVGFKEEEASDNIQMSIYWSHRDWHDIGIQIEKPDGVIQSRGFIEDLPKIKKCNQMEPNLKTNQAIKYRYKLKGEPVPHGFRQQKYFLAFWERI